jgi:hypothetical protein
MLRIFSVDRQRQRQYSEVGMSQFARQLVYKAEISGARVMVADRWFPSNKDVFQLWLYQHRI